MLNMPKSAAGFLHKFSTPMMLSPVSTTELTSAIF